ncbi:hypothetical protein MCEMAEM4_03421 [Burkholderiaceae bacterium]
MDAGLVIDTASEVNAGVTVPAAEGECAAIDADWVVAVINLGLDSDQPIAELKITGLNGTFDVAAIVVDGLDHRVALQIHHVEAVDGIGRARIHAGKVFVVTRGSRQEAAQAG